MVSRVHNATTGLQSQHRTNIHLPRFPPILRSLVQPSHHIALAKSDKFTQLYMWNKPLMGPLVDRAGLHAQQIGNILWSQELLH